MNPNKEIEIALDVISTATDKWDHEEKQGPLWRAAHNFPKEMIQYFYKQPQHQHSIAWCLANVKNSDVKKFFLKEVENKDQFIRWYAIRNLRKYSKKGLVEIFIKGLKDRSSLVKSESLIAIEGIRDDRIKNALQHLLTLKSFKKNSPGSYAEAYRILKTFEDI